MPNTKRTPRAAPIYAEQSYTTEESIGFLLGRCLNRISEEIDRSMAPLGVRSQQFGILHAIYKGQAKTPADLVRTRFQNSAAIAYTLDVLEDRQLLTRSRSVQDRRGVELELTAAGKTLTKQCIPKVVDAQNRLLGTLNVDEYNGLREMLLRVTRQGNS